MKTSVIAGTNEFLKYGISCYHGVKRIEDERDWHAIVLLKIVMGTGALFKVDFGTGRLDMPFYRKNKHCLSLMINNFSTNKINALIHRAEHKTFGVKVLFAVEVKKDPHLDNPEKYRVVTLDDGTMEGFHRRLVNRVAVEITKDIGHSIEYSDMVNGMSMAVMQYKHAGKSEERIKEAFDQVMRGKYKYG